jgi:putative DNA methylase
VRKKIIELRFPTKSVSEYGSHERYIRKAHPYGAKTWWARRPLTSMRALVFATAANAGDSDVELVKKLACEVNPDLDILQRAREWIQRSYQKHPPQMIDFFSGGGGIPLEAARLGIKSYSVELNPVAVVLQKALLEATQSHEKIADDLDYWGKIILDRAEEALRPFFTNPSSEPIWDEEPIVYFWSRMVKCANCGLQTPLSRLSYLAKRSNRTVTISFDPEVGVKGSWNVAEYYGASVPQTKQRSPEHCCAFCSKPIPSGYLKTEGREGRIGKALQAVALSGSAYKGKRYVSSASMVHGKLPKSEDLITAIQSLEKNFGGKLHQFPLKQWSGIVNPTVYGYSTADQLFDKRQLLVLLTMIHELRKAHSEMITTGLEKERANSIILILTSLVDHLADWNSAFTMWIPQNEQCGRSLAGPGIPMLWDYIEINPFGSGPANLRDKLKRIVESIAAIPEFEFPIEIRQGSALELPYSDEFFDLAVIDPPYHDSLFYSALSDCFFPWQKLVLEGSVLPVGSLIAPDEKSEIVASRHRHQNRTVASDQYKVMMTQALEEAYRVLKPSGYLTMVYSHKTIEGWAAIAQAIRGAGFSVVQTWPLYMERRARPRAMKSDALSSAVAIVLRKRNVNSAAYLSDTLKQHIEQELKKHFALLQQDGWLGTDLLVACVAQSLVYFTTGSDLVKDEKSVSFGDYLENIQKTLQRILYGKTPEELWNSDTVKDSDMPTRVYLAWRKRYGETTLTEDEFRKLCEYVEGKVDCARLLEEQQISPFQRRGNKIAALRADERDINRIQSLPPDKQTYIDKVHLLISSRVFNDHRVNQAMELREDDERDRILAVLTMLSGTELTSLEYRRLDPEKLSVRKLLSRLAGGVPPDR